MKVLLLSIFNESDYYNQMREIQRKYVNRSNIFEYYFITYKEDLAEDIQLVDDMLYIKGIESYMNILEKTVIAMNYFINTLKKEYDFVIRTNVSTIFNYILLFEYLKFIPKENIYLGGCTMPLGIDIPFGITKFKQNLYSIDSLLFVQGTCIIMSIDTIKYILQNLDKLKYDIIDDVSIAIFLNKYLSSAYESLFKLPHPLMTHQSFNEKSSVIRCKHDNKPYNILFMNEIVNYYLSLYYKQ